jgi:branched-chain amino acid transport system permease protein
MMQDTKPAKPSASVRADAVPLVLFALAAFALPVLLSGNRYFAFIAGVTLIHVLWACGMNLL